MNNRKELMENIENLLDTYCNGCFLFQHNKNENGRRYAHQFCIKKCTVGDQLKKIGQKLS
ncbi:zinc-finger domain-containing protein [Caldibacillus lycopersici]|uniref:Zinc-finger domain-containing protein n=1 Tax=Perspicuibacillus lycopersici TaxID=1325689 RepID=A0AAE3IVH4_9BACI|nr:zinc-finger domain-containing protein [Perspicuibacillus lycopersici]MCU9613649.1 zinc-finger domain-containing protein [Perspicuibacillus lycopersici]